MTYQPKSYRKFVATAATATLVATAFAPFASAHSFKDVETKYEEAVNFLVSKGVSGYADGTFKTQKTITRIEAAEMLGKALGLDKVTDAPASGFTDVPERVVTLINAFKAKGITTGKTATTFAPNAEITRGELAVWIQKAYDLKAKEGSTNKFTDVADNYKAAVQALVDNKITSGTSETTFGTTESAKRGDFAIFVKKAADAAVVKEVAVESVSAINANELEVKFNKAIEKTEDVKFELKKGNLVYDVTVKFNKEKTVATLTSAVKLPAGEFTVNVTGVTEGTLTSSVKVEAETAHKVVVTDTTVTSKNDAQVKFQVLNQYDKDFSNALAADVVASVYNTTKGTSVTGVTVKKDVNTGQLTLDFADALIKEDSNKKLIHNIGDDLRITLTYKGLTTQSTVKIVEDSSTSSIDLTDVVLGKDQKRITAGESYELKYEMLDQFGKAIKLAETTANKDKVTNLETISGVKFSSSNPAVVSVDEFVVDAEGKLTFEAKAKGKATITALVEATGKVATFEIEVNEASQITTLNISAPTKLVAGSETVELSATATNQYGEAIKAADITGVTWESSNAELVNKDNITIANGVIAVVTEDVTDVKAGTVKLTAKDANGKELGTVSFEVNETAKVASIKSVDVSPLFEQGAEETITANDITAKDQYGRDYKVSTFTVTDESSPANDAINVDSNNPAEVKLTASASIVGNEKITVTVNNVKKEITLGTIASSSIDSYALSVKPVIYGEKSQNASSSHAETVTLKGSSNGKLVALVSNQPVALSTSDISIADVEGSKVFGKKAGTATITAFDAKGKKVASETITVSENAPVITKVVADQVELTVSGTKTNQIKFEDQYGVEITSNAVVFTSSDKEVATVDKSGLITAVKAGKADITVITSNGLVKTISVTVKQ